jgi:hypothetical protein
MRSDGVKLAGWSKTGPRGVDRIIVGWRMEQKHAPNFLIRQPVNVVTRSYSPLMSLQRWLVKPRIL